MKKLMIAACAVALAAAAQAGRVSWTITNVYAGNNTDKISGNAYLFSAATIADSAVAAAINDAWAGYTDMDGNKFTGKDGLTAFLNEKALGANGTAVTWTPSEAGTYSVAVGSYTNEQLGLANSTEYTLYAVIFDDTIDNIDDTTKMFVTGTKTATTKGEGSTNMGFGIGNQATRSKNPDNWTTASGSAPIPEPTSGLLMLLGMGALALRRRRA